MAIGADAPTIADTPHFLGCSDRKDGGPVPRGQGVSSLEAGGGMAQEDGARRGLLRAHENGGGAEGGGRSSSPSCERTRWNLRFGEVRRCA